MSSSLTESLNASVVRLVSVDRGLLGTGFFIAESIVVTCNHVVRGVDPKQLICEWRNEGDAVTEVLVADDVNDVAVLRVPFCNPSVPQLVSDWIPGDDVYAFGFSVKKPRGEALTAQCEGLSYSSKAGADPLIKIKFGQVRAGLSGAPLMNLRTKGVCGIVSRSRDKRSDLGGLAIQIGAVSAQFPVDVRRSEGTFGRWSAGLPTNNASFRIDLAPGLDSNIVDRPAATKSVETFLMDEKVDNQLIAVASFQGLAGIGKTTLATIIAHDETVIGKFPDGTLWVTLGQAPDIIQGQLGWLDAFGRRAQSSSIEALSGLLRQLLRNRRCLLIIDNAWTADAVKPFLVGGPSCRTIITTRREEIAAEVGAALTRLPQMTDLEGLSLLERRLGRSLGGAERVQAQRAMAAVENLPLALEQIAALVLKGQAWDKLNIDLRKEVARLDALRAPSDRLKGATSRVEAALRLSSDVLKAEMPDVWTCFVRLALLADGAIITAAVCVHLWDKNEETAEAMLCTLSADALLIPIGNITLRRRGYRAFRLHDLFRDLVRKVLVQDEPIGLAADIVLEHRAYLDRFRQTNRGLRRWQRFPDDGYIRDHLVWHMIKAEFAGAVINLFRSRSWYDARVERGSPRGYLRDLELAWELADREDGPRRRPDRLKDQFRMALCYSSVHSMSRAISPALIAEFVRHNLLAVEGALWYAETVSDPLLRLRVKLELCEWLSDEEAQRVLRDALFETRFVANDDSAGIEADIARAMARRGFWDLLLRTVARSAPAKQVRILRVICDVKMPSTHVANVMAALRPHDPAVRADLLISALKCGNAGIEVRTEALKAGADLPRSPQRIQLQLLLIPFLDRADRENAFADALLSAKQLPDGRAEAEAAAALLAAIPCENVAELYRSIAVRFSLSNQAKILAKLSTLIPDADAVALLNVLLERSRSLTTVLLDVLDECMPGYAEKAAQLGDVWLHCARAAGTFDVLARLLGKSGIYMPVRHVDTVVRLLLSRLVGSGRISAVICAWLESTNDVLVETLEDRLSDGALMDDVWSDEACAAIASAFGLRAAAEGDLIAASLCELYACQVEDPELSIELMGTLIDILGEDAGAEYIAALDDLTESILTGPEFTYYKVIAKHFNRLSLKHREMFVSDLFDMQHFGWDKGADLQDEAFSLVASALPRDFVREYLETFSGINDGESVAAALRSLDNRSDYDEAWMPEVQGQRRIDALLRKAATTARQPALGFCRHFLEQAIGFRDFEAMKAILRIVLRYADVTTSASLITDVLWQAEFSQGVLDDLGPEMPPDLGAYLAVKYVPSKATPRAVSSSLVVLARSVNDLEIWLPLVPYCSPSQRSAVIRQAMAVVDRDDVDILRRVDLAGLVWKFGADAVPTERLRAFCASVRLNLYGQDVFVLARVLRRLAPIMLADQRDDANRVLRTLEVSSGRSALSIARATIALAPVRGLDILDTALGDLVPVERVMLLTSEIDVFPMEDRPRILGLVEKTARRIVIPSQRFDAHLRIARITSGQRQLAHVTEMADLIGGASLTDELTFSASYLLALLGATGRDAVWRQYLHRAARNPRPDFLESLDAFRFFAALHGGNELWGKMRQVIDETARIWP